LRHIGNTFDLIAHVSAMKRSNQLSGQRGWIAA